MRTPLFFYSMMQPGVQGRKPTKHEAIDLLLISVAAGYDVVEQFISSYVIYGCATMNTIIHYHRCCI
jgi:hypothetical protein